MKFEQVEQRILTQGWFRFGEKEFECPDLSDEAVAYYTANRKLPPVCDTCYKALVFWEGSYSEENVVNLLNMINSFGFELRGKFDENVVVFYFHDKAEMLEFLHTLREKMRTFNVKGKIQWRRACKEYQNLLPNLWKNAKEFIGDA